MGSSTGPKINSISTSGDLLLLLDASDITSYPKTGTTWTDLSGKGNNGTLANGPTYNSSNAGSIVFDGSNDCVTLATNSVFNFGTGDFSIFCWIRTSKVSSANTIFSLDDTASGNGIMLFSNVTTGVFRTWVAGQVLNSSASIANGLWNHVGITRRSGTVYQYINGVQVGSFSAPGTVLTTQIPRFGNANNSNANMFQGNISMCHIYNRALSDSEALDMYNSTKSKFVYYDSFADYTVLYVRGNGTIGDTTVPNLIRGGGNITLTAGTTLSDTQKKWGGVSLKLTNANLAVGPAITSIGTGDFTMELWIYVTAQNSDCRYFGGGGLNQGGFGSRIVGSRYIGMVIDGVSWYAEVGFSPILNAWTHLAACRSGTTVRYFQNGSLIGSASFTQSITMSTPYLSEVTSTATGTWINDARITRAARYTAAFTAPTNQFDLPF